MRLVVDNTKPMPFLPAEPIASIIPFPADRIKTEPPVFYATPAVEISVLLTAFKL